MPKASNKKKKPSRPSAPTGKPVIDEEIIPHRQLYVGNLAGMEMTDLKLRQLFEACGDITSIDLHNTATNAFGFVDFATVDEATRAVEMMNGQSGMVVRFSRNPIASATVAKSVGPAPKEESEEEEAEEPEEVEEEPKTASIAVVRDDLNPVQSLQDLVQKATRTTSTCESIIYTIEETSKGEFIGKVQILVPAGQASHSSSPRPNKREAKKSAAQVALRDPEVHRLLPPLPAKAQQFKVRKALAAESDDEEGDESKKESDVEGEDGEDAPNDEDDEEDEDDDDDDDDEEEEQEEESEEEEDEDSDDEEPITVSTKLRTLSWPLAGKKVVVVTGGIAPKVVDVPGGAVAALRVSPDAVAVLRWLEEVADTDTLPRDAALFLELGCGVGLLGLACAVLRPKAQVVLTDIDEVLPFAQRSIDANPDEIGIRVATRALPFGEVGAVDAVLKDFRAAETSEAVRPVVAIGAAITYWECVYEPLVETLVELCRNGGLVIIGYFRRDWKVERRFWTKLLPQSGLTAEIVWEGEVEDPENTSSFAPVCSRTPGECNARVYRISTSLPAFNPPPRNPVDDSSSTTEPFLDTKSGKKDPVALKREKELRTAEQHKRQQEQRQAKLDKKKSYKSLRGL